MANILMLHRTISCAVLCTILCSTLAPAWADRYYTDSDRPGWYWKNDPPEEEKQEPEKQSPRQSPPQKAESQQENKDKQYEWQGRKEILYSDFTPQQIWDMKPPEFEKLLSTFKEQAVWRPTEHHVRDHLKMLDLTRRKALAYQNVQQYVVQTNSDLSLEHDYPISAPGKEAVKQLSKNDINSRLNVSRENYGLVYFYQDNCPYCSAQDKILEHFIASRKWTVKPVNIREYPELAAKFNISITPSLILVKKGNDGYLPLSNGVISIEELSSRTYNGVRLLNGEITPEQYEMREYEKGGAFDPLAPLR